MKRLALLVALCTCFASLSCTGTAPLPEAALAHNQNGAHALSTGDLETAAANLEVALEYSPEFVEALTNLGLVELNRGNFERARQLLSRARRLNPDIAQPHHGLGVLAEREHRRDVASDHYRAALQVDPGFGAARENLARLLLEAGYSQRAFEQYRKLLQISPGSLSARAGAIEALLRLGRDAEAQQLTVESLALAPDHPQLVLLSARHELKTGQIAAARAALEPLLDRQDDHGVAARAWAAVIELAQEQPALAAEHAQVALDLDPDHPLSLYALAVALDELGAPEAQSWLSRAALVNPNNPELTKRIAGAH